MNPLSLFILSFQTTIKHNQNPKSDFSRRIKELANKNKCLTIFEEKDTTLEAINYGLEIEKLSPQLKIKKLNREYEDSFWFKSYKTNLFLKTNTRKWLFINQTKLAVQVFESNLLQKVKVLRNHSNVYYDKSQSPFTLLIFVLTILKFDILKLTCSLGLTEFRSNMLAYNLITLNQPHTIQLINFHFLPEILKKNVTKRTLIRRNLILLSFDKLYDMLYDFSVYNVYMFVRVQVKFLERKVVKINFDGIVYLELQADLFFLLDENSLISMQNVRKLKLIFKNNYFDPTPFQKLTNLNFIHTVLLTQNTDTLIKNILSLNIKNKLIEDTSLYFYNLNLFNEEREEFFLVKSQNQVKEFKFQIGNSQFNHLFQKFKISISEKTISLYLKFFNQNLINLVTSSPKKKHLTLYFDKDFSDSIMKFDIIKLVSLNFDHLSTKNLKMLFQTKIKLDQLIFQKITFDFKYLQLNNIKEILFEECKLNGIINLICFLRKFIGFTLTDKSDFLKIILKDFQLCFKGEQSVILIMRAVKDYFIYKDKKVIDGVEYKEFYCKIKRK